MIAFVFKVAGALLVGVMILGLVDVRSALAHDARKENGLTSAADAMTLQRLAEAIRALTLAADNVEWPNGKPGE